MNACQTVFPPQDNISHMKIAPFAGDYWPVSNWMIGVGVQWLPLDSFDL